MTESPHFSDDFIPHKRPLFTKIFSDPLRMSTIPAMHTQYINWMGHIITLSQ
jgi:hypothetical protein